MTPRDAIDIIGPGTVVEYIRRLRVDGKEQADYALVTALIFSEADAKLADIRNALAALGITECGGTNNEKG